MPRNEASPSGDFTRWQVVASWHRRDCRLAVEKSSMIDNEQQAWSMFHSWCRRDFATAIRPEPPVPTDWHTAHPHDLLIELVRSEFHRSDEGVRALRVEQIDTWTPERGLESELPGLSKAERQANIRRLNRILGEVG